MIDYEVFHTLKGKQLVPIERPTKRRPKEMILKMKKEKQGYTKVNGKFNCGHCHKTIDAAKFCGGRYYHTIETIMTWKEWNEFESARKTAPFPLNNNG
jgi:hypothetical protein